MVTIESSAHVSGMRAETVMDFLTHPSDDVYRRWWPGVHLALHPVNDKAGPGQAIFMDEFVGSWRLRFTCVVTARERNAITLRFRRVVALPAWLSLEVVDDEHGATVKHTISAGFRSRVGRLLDPLLRLYLSPRFERAMHEHFVKEFSVLPQVLAGQPGVSA